jgi:deuterolysin
VTLSFPRRNAVAHSQFSAPESVDSIDAITLTAVVTNNADTDIKVLKYGTILDFDGPTKSFVVTKDGQEAAFTGVKLSVDLTQIDDSAIATIPAGQSITVDHDSKPSTHKIC